jgi:hypothetical protein
MTGCAMFNKPYVQDSQKYQVQPDFELHVVQSDDYGSFWDVKQAQATLDRVEASSKDGNTLVVLFIHGWHHNADPTDKNLQQSIEALNELKALLNTPERRKLRQKQTTSPDVNLVGIYVGWRGRSLPSLLDYLTFWGRKNTAERVGEGDVSEFIERLQRIYLRANGGGTNDEPPAQQPKTITGLVTLGHSFGAQVLWKALARQLESPLTQRSRCLADRLSPTVLTQLSTEEVAFNTLGDLNILINPALEAYQFARVDSLYRQVKFLTEQTPQLVVFSSDNDDVRKIWFPVGRAVTGPFRPNFRSEGDARQARLWGRALGEVDDQISHTLARSKPAGAADSLTEQDYLTPDKIRAYDFTQPTTFAGITLTPSAGQNGRAPRVPNSPVLVVRTEEKIVDGHNGIFEPGFRQFLARYITFIEGKRLVLRQENSRDVRGPTGPTIGTTVKMPGGKMLRGDPGKPAMESGPCDGIPPPP